MHTDPPPPLALSGEDHALLLEARARVFSSQPLETGLLEHPLQALPLERLLVRAIVSPRPGRVAHLVPLRERLKRYLNDWERHGAACESLL